MTGRWIPFHLRQRPTQSRSRLHLEPTPDPFHLRPATLPFHVKQRSDLPPLRPPPVPFHLRPATFLFHLRPAMLPFHVKPGLAPFLLQCRGPQMLVLLHARQRSDRLQPGPATDRFRLMRASVLFHVKQTTSQSPSSHRSGTSWPHPCPSRERRRPWPKPSRQTPVVESP